VNTLKKYFFCLFERFDALPYISDVETSVQITGCGFAFNHNYKIFCRQHGIDLIFILILGVLDHPTFVLVIPPFLMGLSRRIHAAVFSFIAGVMPPMPMLGLIVVSPEPFCRLVLGLLNRFKDVLVQPFAANGAIVSLDIGLLLRFAEL